MNTFKATSNASSLIGALLGGVTYTALLISPLSRKLDEVLLSYYGAKLPLDEGGILSLPMWGGMALGLLTFAFFIIIARVRLLKEQRWGLSLGGIAVTLSWSPVFLFWDYIWSPALLIICLAWMEVCHYTFKKIICHSIPNHSEPSVDEYIISQERFEKGPDFLPVAPENDEKTLDEA